MIDKPMNTQWTNLHTACTRTYWWTTNWHVHTCMNKQTYVQMNKHTFRQTDICTDEQTDRCINLRGTDRRTKAWMNTCMSMCLYIHMHVFIHAFAWWICIILINFLKEVCFQLSFRAHIKILDYSLSVPEKLTYYNITPFYLHWIHES